VDLGPDRSVPEPRVRDDDAAGEFVMAVQEEGAAYLAKNGSGKQDSCDIVADRSGPPPSPKLGRGAFACLVYGDTTGENYVKAEGMAGRMGVQLLSVVAEGNRQRTYLAPSDEHVQAAAVVRPTDGPEALMPDDSC